jgi:hypothetical protein
MDVRTNGNSHNVAIAALLMLLGREINKFEMRRVNHLRVESEEGYWATECYKCR